MLLSEHFVIGVLGAIVGGVVTTFGAWIHRNIQEWRGWLTGEWTQSIPPFAGRPAREDRVECRHRRERIEAKITRVIPKEDTPKNWVFDGALRQDGSLVGFFLGVEANSDSYGVIFLRKEGRNKFGGHYMKLLNQGDLKSQTVPTEVVKRELIPLTWTRIRREGCIRRLCSHYQRGAALLKKDANAGVKA